MARLRFNGLDSALGAPLAPGDTTITFPASLTCQGGTALPTLLSGDYIPLSIIGADGRLSEIVYLNSYTSGATTGTVIRGQEGTTAVAHTQGDKVVHSATARDVSIPEKGTPGQALVKKSGNDFDLAWRTLSGKFRGEWVSEALATKIQFTATGDLPAPLWTSSQGGGGYLPQIVSSPVPAGEAYSIDTCAGDAQSGFRSDAQLNLSQLNIPGITRVKLQYCVVKSGSYTGWAAMRVYVSGVKKLDTAPNGIGWTAFETPAGSDDTLLLERASIQNIANSFTAHGYWGDIEIYATPDPFMSGDYTTFEGRLWRSNIDNNGSTPGADGNWTQIIVAGSKVITATASYTAAITDADCTVAVNSATAATFTVPPNSSAAFAIGTRLRVVNMNTGAVTITAGAGVTLNKESSATLMLKQWQAASVLKTATDTWVVVKEHQGSLANLTDVDVSATTPVDRQRLSYQASNGKWVPYVPLLTADTTTAYTLKRADEGGTATLNNAAAVTVTVPANATVALPVGSSVRIINIGAGVATVTADAGVTINVATGKALALNQNDSILLVKVATDTWQVV